MDKIEFGNNLKRFIENYDPKTHYQERKNFLQRAFEEIILDEVPFRIMNTYTNSGKSFTATQSIIDLYNEFEQLVFLFNKKSNMPNCEYMNAEIEKRYGVKNAVLFIDNNTDNLLTNKEQLNVLKENLLNVMFRYSSDINEDIREEILKALERLISSLNTYQNVKKDKNMDTNYSSDYIDFITERVRNDERTFKNAIKKHYKEKSITEFADFYDYTKNHNVFNCLLELYPHLSFPNKKIIVMTVDKFYSPMDFIINSAPDFLASKGVGKNTIFIKDESDETYWNRLKKIVDTGATRNQDFDLFTLAKDIYNGTKYRDKVSLAVAPSDDDFVVRLGEDSNTIKQAFAFLQNIDCGNLEFRDISHYKLVANEECKKVNIFISEDMGIQLEVEGNIKGRVKCRFDDENELIHLYVDENDDDGNSCYFINIVSNILDAEKVFKRTVFSLAIAYYESELPYRPDFTKVKALTTLLSTFTGNSSLAQKYSSVFTEEFESIYSAKPIDSEKLLSNDFSLISIESFVTILGEGYLRTTENNKSPEQELVRLIQNSRKVVFLSATGALKSVLCNYNIEAVCKYLKINTEDVLASPEEIMLYKESTEYMQKTYFPTKCSLYDDFDACMRKNNAFEAMLQKQHRKISAILNSKKFKEIHGIKSRKGIKDFLDKIDPSKVEYLFTQFPTKTDKKLGAVRFYNILLSVLCEMEKSKNRSILVFANGDDFYVLKTLFLFLNENILPDDNQIYFDRFVAIGKEGINQKTIDLFYDTNKQQLKSGAAFVLLTTYNSAAAGVNFFRIIDSEEVDFSDELNDNNKNYYCKFTDEERLLSNVFEHPSLDDEHIYLKSDIDAIYSETKTHIVPNPEGTNEICRFHSFYIFTALCKRDEDYKIFSEDKRIETCNEIYSMNANKVNPLHKILKYYSVDIIDFAVAFLRNLAQSIGRRSRNSFGVKEPCVYVCNDKWTKAITNLKRYGFDTELSVIPDTQAIIDAFLNYVEPNNELIDCTEASVVLEKSVGSLFDKNVPDNFPYKELYQRIIKKEHWLSFHPTMSQKEMEEKCANDKVFEMFVNYLYIKNENHELGYINSTDDNFKCTAGWINNGCISGREFSAASLYYDVLEKYLSVSNNTMKPHFDTNDEYIVHPAFADVVRGDVGELLFEAIIIYQNLISELKKNYEFFDYSIDGKNRVIDVKYFDTDANGFRNRIKEKIDHIEDKLNKVFNNDKDAKVLFVNMHPYETGKRSGVIKLTENIYFATSIIDEEGNVNPKTLEAVINFLTV